MDFLSLMVSFVVLMFIVCGVIIFALQRVLISSTDGAVRRLQEENERAKKEHDETMAKLRAAEADLKKRQSEAKQLADKMMSEAEEQTKEQREKSINKAREEGEEIIMKAKGATEKMKLELIKEMDVRAIEFAMRMLNEILSQKSQSVLNDVLVDEFIHKLKTVDMSKIDPSITAIDLVSVAEVSEAKKKEILAIVKEKLGKEVSINSNIDQELGGGIILKFGSMALDGTIKNDIREIGLALQEEVLK